MKAKYTDVDIVVLSAFKDDLNEHRNMLRNQSLSADLFRSGLSSSNLESKYKGKSEFSFIVLIDDEKQLQTAFDLAEAYNQDYVLILGHMKEGLSATRDAVLHNIETEQPEKTGSWFLTCKEEAEQADSYTKLSSDAYFIVEWSDEQ